MYKTQQLYNELSANKEDWEISYIEVKKLFYEEYYSLHKCCPNCGSEDYMGTLMDMEFYIGKMDDYKDINRCTCEQCGDTHIYHDRIPSPKHI
jgi:hypothetical protein